MQILCDLEAGQAALQICVYWNHSPAGAAADAESAEYFSHKCAQIEFARWV